MKNVTWKRRSRWFNLRSNHQLLKEHRRNLPATILLICITCCARIWFSCRRCSRCFLSALIWLGGSAVSCNNPKSFIQLLKILRKVFQLTFPDIVGVVSESIFLMASTFSCRRFFSSGDSSGACSGMYRSGIRILLGAPKRLSMVFSEIFSRGPRADRTISGALMRGRSATSMSRSSRARQLTFWK